MVAISAIESIVMQSRIRVVSEIANMARCLACRLSRPSTLVLCQMGMEVRRLRVTGIPVASKLVPIGQRLVCVRPIAVSPQ